jgi:two-component system cell cycle sensor histidine kinase/response regulator CckA
MSILKMMAGVLLWAASTFLGAQSPPTAAVPAPVASITVVLDDNYPPYIFRDAHGELQGILKDTWALWQARTGIEVKLQAMDWAAAQAVMQDGRADVIDTLFKTAPRLTLYDFSRPYAQLDVAIYFHRSISGIADASALRGFTVGVKDGDACIDQLSQHGIGSMKKYASYSDVVAAAAAGELRVFCMDEPPAGYLLNQHGLGKDFRHSPAIAGGAFHRAVRKGNLTLLTTLEDGFARITADEYKQIDEKWLGSAIHGMGFGAYRQYLRTGALLLMLAVAVLGLWILMLRRKVRERTADLSAMLCRLQEAQHRTEALLRDQKAMLNNEMIGFVKTVNRVIVWTNPAFEAMSGYTRGELIGTSTRLHFPSEQAFVSFGEVAYPAMATDLVFRAQTEFVCKDGKHIWIDLSGAKLDTVSGETLWVFLDITEQVRAQAARDAAASRLEKLANRAPGMLYQFLLRPDGSACIPYASEAIRDAFRLSPQQVSEDATPLFAAVHPDDLKELEASIALSAKNLTHWQHEFRAKFGDAEVHWLFGNSVPERLPDGSVLWHGFVTDITEQRTANEKLRQLSRVVEQAPLAIVIADLQGHIDYANPAFCTSTGYSLQDVRGQNPRVLQSGLTASDVYTDMWQTLVAGEVWSGKFHNRKKNGDLYIEQAVIAPVLDEQGHATHYVAIKEDITLRMRAEVELQASLREKVALLNEVHHRVKNNLQVITSLLRLEAGRSDLPGTRAVLQEMQGRIQSMALLHEALYRGHSFASVDLGAYLRQLATQALRAQGASTGAVRLVLELAPASVALDQATPCGLLVNELLSNALKHGFPQGRSGEITVQSHPASTPGHWQVCVRDTGVGLPDDFEARRERSLGLQLVSDLSRQLGGTLECCSGPGPGTAFCISFALAETRLPTAH